MTTEPEALSLWTQIDDVFLPDRKHPWWPWFCPKPTVKILFYTDDPTVVANTTNTFGVGLLRDLMLTHNTFHTNFQIDVLDRHAGGHAAQKLTPVLLRTYDQLWFFGVRQCNVTNQPQNELTDPEVAALQAWMDEGGGVLMTGDHANPRPAGADPGLDSLVNLGRALGHRVPRAGELRRWEGLPNAVPGSSSHNTQEPDGVNNLDNLTLQDDAIPQRLILTKYSVGWILPFWLRRYRPHPLFCGRKGPIEVFPDHMHEGQLEIPSAFPPANWPSGPGGQPLPEIIARGTDKRNGSVYGVTSAYDGAMAGVGRIVADATWHHYFNINLVGFPAGSTTRESIADFFVNLGIWLSPPAKRHQMRCWFWWYLAVHPTVRMVAGHPYSVLGATALDVLGRRASQCLITELVWPWPVFEVEREKFPWPPEELVLGGVLAQYQEVFARAAEDPSPDLPGREEILRLGVRAGLEEHAKELRRAAEAAEELRGFAEEKFRGQERLDDAAE
jgi:hypothetical protein